jgi:hypothetical protein
MRRSEGSRDKVGGCKDLGLSGEKRVDEAGVQLRAGDAERNSRSGVEAESPAVAVEPDRTWTYNGSAARSGDSRGRGRDGPARTPIDESA